MILLPEMQPDGGNPAGALLSAGEAMTVRRVLLAEETTANCQDSVSGSEDDYPELNQKNE